MKAVSAAGKTSYFSEHLQSTHTSSLSARDSGPRLYAFPLWLYLPLTLPVLP